MSLISPRRVCAIAGLTAILAGGSVAAGAPSRASTGAGFVYGGTADGEPFALWVSADRTRVTGMMFYAEGVKCTGGYDGVDFHERAWIDSVLYRYTGPEDDLLADADQLGPDGTFHASADWNMVSYGNDGVTGFPDEQLSGRVTGDSAAGTFSVSMILDDKHGQEFARCRTGTVHWTARTAPRAVFVGAAFDHPVVIELTPDRRRVRRLVMGLHGQCRYGAYDSSTEETSLAIRGNRFSLADHWNESAGGHERDIGRSTGTGTIEGTRASGTYGETDTFVNRHARVTDVCQFRRFHWSAVSSPADFPG
jgi:hypothetical protein